MEYYIALPSNAGIDGAAFVEAWNADPEMRAHADARVEHPAGIDLLDDQPTPALFNLAAGMQTNALYDSIKYVLFNAGLHKQIEISRTDVSDERVVLTVNVVEEPQDGTDAA